jgi:hypothetical protein
MIFRKEFIQALRDPQMRGILIVLPLVQLLIFGYAVNLDVNTAEIAWMDQDHSPESRELLSEFQGSGRFIIAGEPQSDAAMQSMLDRGQVDAVVRVLPGFARDIERGRVSSVQVLLDGTNSNTASLVSSYASSTIARYSNEVLDGEQRKKMIAGTEDSGGALHAAVPQVTTRSRVWFNPDLRSRNFFIPGIIVNIITIATLSLTATAIVREKEIGTMEQLMVTPIRPVELILGYVPGDDRGSVPVPHSLRGQFRPADRGDSAVPADDARRGTVHLHDLADAAAGEHGDWPDLPAVLHVERVHVPDPQHAGDRAMDDLSESGALLHGDRTRRVPARRGRSGAVAADGGAGGFRRGDSVGQRAALPQTTRIAGSVLAGVYDR